MCFENLPPSTRAAGARPRFLFSLILLSLLFVPALRAKGDKRPEPQPQAETEKPKIFKALRVGPRQVFRGEPISLSLRDADLKEVLRSFARLADVNLILDPRVEGKVTVELHDVPWDQALYVILKTHRLGAVIEGRIWTVQPLIP